MTHHPENELSARESNTEAKVINHLKSAQESCMPGAERTSRAGEPSGRAGRASQADEPDGGRAKQTSRANERSRADARAGQLGARRTGDEERHRIRFYFFFFSKL